MRTFVAETNRRVLLQARALSRSTSAVAMSRSELISIGINWYGDIERPIQSMTLCCREPSIDQLWKNAPSTT
jgi:hypothetical protein